LVWTLFFILPFPLLPSRHWVTTIFTAGWKVVMMMKGTLFCLDQELPGEKLLGSARAPRISFLILEKELKRRNVEPVSREAIKLGDWIFERYFPNQRNMP